MIWNIWQIRAQYSSAASWVFVDVCVDIKETKMLGNQWETQLDKHTLYNMHTKTCTPLTQLSKQSKLELGLRNILYIDNTVSSYTIRSLRLQRKTLVWMSTTYNSTHQLLLQSQRTLSEREWCTSALLYYIQSMLQYFQITLADLEMRHHSL